MKTIPFTSRWASQRWATIMTENSERNTGFTSPNALQFYFGKIIKKKAFELTPELIETYSKYNLVKDSDIIINGLNLNYDFVTQRIGIVVEPGIITSAYLSMRVRSDYNPMFYCYLLKSMDARKIFHGMGTGIRLTLSYKELRNILLPVPPRDEQDQIVRFLDWKMSGINKLIASKQKEIALVRECRTAEIDKAVTHGVRNEELKSSGMSWLPMIPKGWDTIPAKALFSHHTELRHEGDEMLAATQKYGMIPQQKYMELEGRRIVLATDNLDKWLHVEPEEFIISLRSFQGGLELCTMPGCVTWHYVVLQPKDNVYVPYFKWLFKSASYIGALQRTSDFIRDGQDLRFSNFVKVRLLRIPLSEQKEIADYLEKTVPQFDAIENKLHREIELLQELRDKIIADVVTGKVDVRNIEIPDYEYIEEETDETAGVDGEEAVEESEDL